jgi:phage host-nuclease inhibitor protein Gam
MYKTIALELLEAQPSLYHRLRLSRTLLREAERYATDMRDKHLRLSKEMEPTAAMELAVESIRERIAEAAKA